MSNLTDDNQHYNGVLLEKIYNDIRTILETVVPIKARVDRIPKIEEDIAELKNDIKTIKSALKATNIDLRSHGHFASVHNYQR
ncbi:MAG TPA: hypothetical protein VNX65_00565 [Patescibacteria group bacterium]|nr:hypothetical protein [Patescibacteria group bacterium]